MGRDSTGAVTVYAATRLELSFLLKRGYIKKGCVVTAPLTWSNQRGEQCARILFKSSYLGSADSNFVELTYTLTKQGGETLSRCYKVPLFEQPSNLGKGNVLYFLCPVSMRKCRILYSAYSSDFFKARQAYRYRLYYDCQQASKLSKYNDNYWRLEAHLKKLQEVSCKGKRTYKASLTKAAQRYNRLLHKQWRMDDLRWTAGVPKSLKAVLYKDGLD